MTPLRFANKPLTPAQRQADNLDSVERLPRRLRCLLICEQGDVLVHKRLREERHPKESLGPWSMRDARLQALPQASARDFDSVVRRSHDGEKLDMAAGLRTTVCPGRS